MQDSYHEAVRVISETESSGGKHRSMLDGIAPDRVHAVDAHSNKSALIPPPLSEIERLAHRSRLLQLDADPPNVPTGARRNLRRRLTPQAIAELVARYNAGEHTPALSRQYGLSKTGLVELLRTEGVPLRRRSMTLQDAERAVRLYESGLTIDEVVKQVGYSYSTIQRLLHQKRVGMRAGPSRRK